MTSQMTTKKTEARALVPLIFVFYKGRHGDKRSKALIVRTKEMIGDVTATNGPQF